MFLAALLLALASAAYSQTTPAFEVATVKTAAQMTPDRLSSGQVHVGMRIDAARVDIGFVTLMDLICYAYDVKQYQVSAPSWIT